MVQTEIEPRIQGQLAAELRTECGGGCCTDTGHAQGISRIARRLWRRTPESIVKYKSSLERETRGGSEGETGAEGGPSDAEALPPSAWERY